MRTEKYYGVLLGLKKGERPFLAVNNDSAPALFYKRHQAMCFKDELYTAPHRLKGRVIPVIVTYSVT